MPKKRKVARADIPALERLVTELSVIASDPSWFGRTPTGTDQLRLQQQLHIVGGVACVAALYLSRPDAAVRIAFILQGNQYRADAIPIPFHWPSPIGSVVHEGQSQLAGIAGTIRAAPVSLAMPRSSPAYLLTLRYQSFHRSG